MSNRPKRSVVSGLWQSSGHTRLGSDNQKLLEDERQRKAKWEADARAEAARRDEAGKPKNILLAAYRNDTAESPPV